MPFAKLRVDAGLGSISFRRNGIFCEDSSQGVVQRRGLDRFGQVSGELQIFCVDLASAQGGQQNDR